MLTGLRDHENTSTRNEEEQWKKKIKTNKNTHTPTHTDSYRRSRKMKDFLKKKRKAKIKMERKQTQEQRESSWSIPKEKKKKREKENQQQRLSGKTMFKPNWTGNRSIYLDGGQELKKRMEQTVGLMSEKHGKRIRDKKIYFFFSISNFSLSNFYFILYLPSSH